MERMMRIYIGVHDRMKDIKPDKVYGVEQVIVVSHLTYYNILSATFFDVLFELKHSGFDLTTFKNDLALIRLDREVSRSEKNGFACLTKTNQVAPGDSIYAIGWGYTEKSRNQGFFFPFRRLFKLFNQSALI